MIGDEADGGEIGPPSRAPSRRLEGVSSHARYRESYRASSLYPYLPTYPRPETRTIPQFNYGLGQTEVK